MNVELTENVVGTPVEQVPDETRYFKFDENGNPVEIDFNGEEVVQTAEDLRENAELVN